MASGHKDAISALGRGTTSTRRRFSWFCHGVLLLHMIEYPNPLHTHGRSSSYIYKDFQHLPLWLMVIRMQYLLVGEVKPALVGVLLVLPLGSCYILSWECRRHVGDMSGNFFQKRHVAATHNTQKEAPTHSFFLPTSYRTTHQPTAHAAEEEEEGRRRRPYYDHCRCCGVCRR